MALPAQLIPYETDLMLVRFFSRTKSVFNVRGQNRRRLQLETLEDRLAPATFTVTTAGDGPGTVDYVAAAR